MRVPAGIGTWPAYWMLPSDNVYGGWLASGEIDIMEHVGCGVGDLFATVHTVLNLAFGGTWGGWCGVDTLSLPQEYRVDWARTYQ